MSNRLKKKQSNQSLKNAIEFLDLDMTMEEMGKKMNYSKAAVSKYLGDFSPSKTFMSKFEEVFNVSLKDFEEADYKQPVTKSNAIQSSNEVMDVKALNLLVQELRERVFDLKESLLAEREFNEYIKKENDKLKSS
jgi:transcriptional regulator with XRE-family HTH domain